MLEPNFITEEVEVNSTYGKFILSPLPPGFGQTFGNALRRVLLSSIEGAAVTYVKIDGVVHPFSTIEGVKESVLDIILNIKLLRFKVGKEGPFEMSLSTRGRQEVKGGDFKGGDVEVINQDQHIADLTTSRAKLEIELTVEKGVGYSPSEEKEKKEFGKIAVDSVFSPIKKVNFTVERTRVGRKTNLDKLNFEVWTDETMFPKEAFKTAATFLAKHLSHILSGRDVKKEEGVEEEKARLKKGIEKKTYEIIIDELDLPTRVVNALIREKIETVGDLVETGKENLIGLKGVGKKSLDLIEKELEKLGIPFDQDETPS